MFQETFSTDAEMYPSPLKARLGEWGYYLGTLAKHLQRQLEFAVKREHFVHSRNSNWDNNYLCRLLSENTPFAEQPFTPEQVLAKFSTKFLTYCDEYCLGKPIAEYPIDGDELRRRQAAHSHHHFIDTDYGQNFEQVLATQGKSQERATIETLNNDRMWQWVVEAIENPQIAVGTKLAWFSPPGYKVEGYAGIDSSKHSFIWIYELRLNGQGQREVVMVQYRCWPNLKQLREIQQSLAPFQTESSALLNDQVPFTQLTMRNQVIAQMLELSPSLSLPEIETLIYEGGDEWAVLRDEMPYWPDDEAKFNQQRERVLEKFLLANYKPILAMPELQLPQEDLFWQSGEYQKLVWELDTVFSISQQGLSKWVEVRDEYYRAKNQRQKERKQKKIFEHVNIDGLQEVSDIARRRIYKMETPDDRKRFNALAPNILSFSDRLLSMGQCGIGSLVPTKLLEAGEISKLGVVGGEDLKKQYRSIELSDSYRKKHYKFWIRIEYYEEYLPPLSYINEQGVPVGPCHISLYEDKENVLTDEEYQEKLQEVSNQDLDSLQTAIKELPVSEEEKQEIQKIVDYLILRLIKTKLGILELWNGDLGNQTTVPADFFLLIANALDQDNPLEALHNLIQQLHLTTQVQEHIEEKISTLKETSVSSLNQNSV